MYVEQNVSNKHINTTINLYGIEIVRFETIRIYITIHIF